MGKINEYQRSQLASTITSTTSADSSGQIIGKSISTIGAALTKRQNALDTAEATKAFYEYSVFANLKASELMQQYQRDPSLDPLTFNEEYFKQVEETAQEFKNKLPDRVQEKFGTLLSRANSAQAITNTKWAFAQQNKNALEGFYSLGVIAVNEAGNSMNSTDYLTSRDKYLSATENYREILDPKHMDAANKVVLKQQAQMYWDNSVDFRHGGRPDQLANELETNEVLRETLKKDLGLKTYNTLVGNLNKFTTQAGLDAGFNETVKNNKELEEKVNNLYDPSSGYGLKEISNEITTQLNRKNYLVDINSKGQHTPTIEQIGKNIGNLQVLKRLAIMVNDSTTTSNVDVKAQLQDEIRDGMSLYRSGKLKKTIDRTQTQIGNQLVKQGVQPWTPSIMRGGMFRNPIPEYRRIYGMFTGVSEGIQLEKREQVKADKTVSEYIETAQTLQGKILNAVEKKDLTYTDGVKLIRQIGMINSVEQYDKLSSQKSNWFTQSFDAFDAYTRQLNLNMGTVEGNRRFRDDIRNQMIDLMTTRVAAYGDIPITPGKVQELIGQIKQEKSSSIYPEFMGVKEGSFVNVGGQQVEFLGYDNDGQVSIRAKDIQKKVGNR